MTCIHIKFDESTISIGTCHRDDTTEQLISTFHTTIANDTTLPSPPSPITTFINSLSLTYPNLSEILKLVSTIDDLLLFYKHGHMNNSERYSIYHYLLSNGAIPIDPNFNPTTKDQVERSLINHINCGGSLTDWQPSSLGLYGYTDEAHHTMQQLNIAKEELSKL